MPIAYLFSLLGTPLATARVAATLPGVHTTYITKYRTVIDKNNIRYYFNIEIRGVCGERLQ